MQKSNAVDFSFGGFSIYLLLLATTPAIILTVIMASQRNLSAWGWPLMLGVAALPILLWFFAAPLDERFSSTYTTLTSLGRVSGIIAATLFCLTLILTARMRLLEDLFGGLNRTYIAHHIMGGIALCVLLTHPIFFALRATMISPFDGALQLLPWGGTPAKLFGVVALWLFIGLMVVTFYAKLPYRIWLVTHKLAGLVLLGMIVHVLLASQDVTAFWPLAVVCWALFGAASLIFVGRTLLPRLFVRRYRYRIAMAHTIEPGVTRIVMQPLGKALTFTSGQFIFASFKAPGFSSEWHPFSITSNSRDEGIAITVKAIGEYSQTLTETAASMKNSEVIIEGAYGRFDFRSFRNKKQVWVAGGIGITPFLSMIDDIEAGYTVDLYYSVKSADEIINWSFLQDAAQRSPGAVQVIPIIVDRDGFLTAKKIQDWSGDLTATDFLFCGPPPMMHALREQLRGVGVRNSRIHSEEFSIT
jgi:predicted ferric reductase